MTSRTVRIEDNWDDCPEGDMDYIADMLGTGFRDKMIATMGGTSVKVPARVSTLTDDHPLVRNLGRVDAEELVDTVPAAIIYVPMGAPSKRDAVAALVKVGKTNNQIARELGISERQVRRHRSKANLNGQQLAAQFGVPFQQLHSAIRSAPSRLLAPQCGRRAILTGG